MPFGRFSVCVRRYMHANIIPTISPTVLSLLQENQRRNEKHYGYTHHTNKFDIGKVLSGADVEATVGRR